jgi:hypothetical protein
VPNQQVRIAVVEGNPGSGAPTPTQNANTWEHIIAVVTIASGDSTIANADIDQDGYNVPISNREGAAVQVSNGTAPTSALSGFTGNMRYVDPIIAAYWANGETLYLSADGGNNFMGAYRYTQSDISEGPLVLGLNTGGTIGTNQSYTATKDHFFVHVTMTQTRSAGYDGNSLFSGYISVGGVIVQEVTFLMSTLGTGSAYLDHKLVVFSGRISCAVGDAIVISCGIVNFLGTTGTTSSDYYGEAFI